MGSSAFVTCFSSVVLSSVVVSIGCLHDSTPTFLWCLLCLFCHNEIYRCHVWVDECFINMDRGVLNIAVFLDLQKAFDTINLKIF